MARLRISARIVRLVFGWGLVASGVFLSMFVVYLVWYTDVVTGQIQAAALETFPDRMASLRSEPRSDTQPESMGADSSETQTTFTPESYAGELGEVVARIDIPEIELEAAVYEGVSEEVLRKGPGHMPHTPLPGQPGNAVISGHRVTYGRPFYRVDELAPDDRILVETPLGLHVYAVRRTFVVVPDAVWVTDPLPGGWLTLTACHPKYSARERIIVQAELVEGPNAAYAMAEAEDAVYPEPGDYVDVLVGEL